MSEKRQGSDRKCCTWPVLILAAALLLAGCTEAAQNKAEDAAAVSTSSGRASVGARALDYDDSLPQEYQPEDRLIIRNAELTIVVDEALASMDEIRGLVKGMDGWEVSSNVWQYDSYKRGSITVRVPADRLDEFLDQVHQLANDVTSESSSGQDVTEEFVDLNAQLANQQATRDRVRNFLDKAQDVEEALAVNAQLSRLEGEIERITGRMQYLEKSARFSSVSIEIIPDELNQPVTIGRWQPKGTARDAIQALLATLRVLVDVLIFLVLLVLPVVVVIGGPIYLLTRLLRRRRNRRRAAAE